MNKLNKGVEKSDRWEVIYEDDISVSIWRYNLTRSTSGPYEVETKWKKNFDPWNQKKKTLSDIVKEQKKVRKS